MKLVNTNKIKELAKEQGRSMAYLCKCMGVTRVYFNDVEKQGRDIPQDKLQIIADVLNTTPEYLRDETDKKEKPLTDDEELAEYLEELKNREEMRMLFSLAKGATKEDVEKAVKIVEAYLKD